MKRRLPGTKRALAVLFALLMLASSCGDASGGSDTSAPETSNDVSAEDTGIALNIQPENNGGMEFRILTTAYAAYENVVEEENGEIVNDAIYRRNMAVEDLLGIKFSYIVGTDSGGASEEGKVLNKLLESSVLAEDNAYDVAANTLVRSLPLGAQGYLYNILDTDINLSNPWWITQLADELAFQGKLYGVTGDLLLSLYKDICVIYFNKSILDEYKLESPYELVHADTWTLDKYLELAQHGDKDLDGNGVMDPAVDQLWSVGQMVPNRAFFTAFNLSVVEMTEDDISFLPLPEKVVDVCNKLWPFFSSENTYVDPKGDHALYGRYFAEGRVLFMNSFIYQTDNLRDMQDDFGIVPYPKLNEDQDRYYSQIGTSSTMLFIPITNDKIELTSKVLESLAYYGSKEVIPTYYESALKEKYTRDTDVQEMLDIVRDSASMNFMYANAESFSWPTPTAILTFAPTDTHYEKLSSWYESRVNVWNTELEKLLESYNG